MINEEDNSLTRQNISQSPEPGKRTYDHRDYMPPQLSEEDVARENEEYEIQDTDVVEESVDVAEEPADVEAATSESITRITETPIPDTHQPGWAKYVSAFFSPVLIPAYCVAVAMWITPLSQISENTRLVATLVVLAVTALLPSLSMAAFVRAGRRIGFDNATGHNRMVPAMLFIVGQVMAAFYLYYIYAPAWLSMILVAGAATTLVFLICNYFVYLSGHTTAIASLCAVVLYLGRNHISDITVTPWLMGFVLLAGLVGSARMALNRHTGVQIAAGYIVGFFVTYPVLNLHLFDARTFA